MHTGVLMRPVLGWLRGVFRRAKFGARSHPYTGVPRRTPHGVLSGEMVSGWTMPSSAFTGRPALHSTAMRMTADTTEAPNTAALRP